MTTTTKSLRIQILTSPKERSSSSMGLQAREYSSVREKQNDTEKQLVNEDGNVLLKAFGLSEWSHLRKKAVITLCDSKAS